MSKTECEHCWHAYRGPYMIVLKDGHVLQQCCNCGEHRQVHSDHMRKEVKH